MNKEKSGVWQTPETTKNITLSQNSRAQDTADTCRHRLRGSLDPAEYRREQNRDKNTSESGTERAIYRESGFSG